MIYHVSVGQKLRYGINWMINRRHYPPELFISIVIPVDLLPRERYMPGPEEFPSERIGRRVKVLGIGISLKARTWESPIGKQEYPPIGEYFKGR